jgi:hypothetical protein
VKTKNTAATLSGITVALVLSGCSDSYADGLIAEAKSNSEISLAAPNGADWSSGIIVCPYTPLNQIPEAYRTRFSDDALLSEGSQWLGFTTTQGIEVVTLSRSEFDFCRFDNAMDFSPGHQWEITTDTDGRLVARDKQQTQ